MKVEKTSEKEEKSKVKKISEVKTKETMLSPKISVADKERFWRLVREKRLIDYIIKKVPNINPRVCKMWFGGYNKGYLTSYGANTGKLKEATTKSSEKRRALKKDKKEKEEKKEKQTVLVEKKTEVKKETKKKKKIDTLIGLEQYKRKVSLLLETGTKGIFIAGFHGLGKSSLVTELAKKNKAKVIRFQITETLTEFDIIGSPNMQSGKFIYSNLVKSLQEANKNKNKTYYVMLDEFTRGPPECKQILFPLLAERVLYINSIYSDIESIAVGDNVKVFATGNLHDSNQCDISQAEMDRYNIIEISPILDDRTLRLIIDNKVEYEDNATNHSIIGSLIAFYKQSWTMHEEKRILAMSIRTFIETARLATRLSRSQRGDESLKNALSMTYYGTSNAVFEPHYMNTYKEMIANICM